MLQKINVVTILTINYCKDQTKTLT